MILQKNKEERNNHSETWMNRGTKDLESLHHKSRYKKSRKGSKTGRKMNFPNEQWISHNMHPIESNFEHKCILIKCMKVRTFVFDNIV